VYYVLCVSRQTSVGAPGKPLTLPVLLPPPLLLLLLLQSRYLNSMTYLNRRSNDRWTSTDTELFYKALTIFGTDFTAIAKLFPGRDR
jgi:hypothetical protein